MLVLEIILQFIWEVIFIDLIGGILVRVNNFVLRLRGIETRSPREIKFLKLRKRYEYKKVKFIRDQERTLEGSTGIVLELINKERAFVELNDEDQTIVESKIKNLILNEW